MTITPETKIGGFLEAHPDLQEALIARVPEFAKLRNPILRRTVAKLATVDAQTLFAAGEHPLARIRRAIPLLTSGKSLLLLSDFYPAPPSGPVPKGGHSQLVRIRGARPLPDLDPQGLISPRHL